jgi:Glycosyl-4,4'-diaponeurosporenoate acyltransferase
MSPRAKSGLAAIAVTPTVVVLLIWFARAFGADGAAFAFAVVWLPMTWLGTVSRIITPRLPARYHALRRFELDGRVYQRLGVGLVKRLLRRGPLAAFNPDLHLPAPGERTPASLARLDQRMRDAEASHAILLVLTVGVAVHAALRGQWGAAGWTLLFDILVNGYPVMLQRSNRGYLTRRFTTGPGPEAGTARAADW